MTRSFNFSPGPAVLPLSVLERAAAELVEWDNTGMSVMEMSHRGPIYARIFEKAQSDLRELLHVPDNYKILFLAAGASAQNAFIPMNLLGQAKSADFVHTGEWSSRSLEEAKRYCEVNVVASSKDNGFTAIPDISSWKLDPNAAYVHICANETIGGLEFHSIPRTGNVPLVADMSSNILSRPIDVKSYGLIYAGAQKNIGPSGLTIVIVRDDLLDRALPITPSVFHYKTQAGQGSMLNTPPTYAIYIAGLVFEWIKEQGGLTAMAAHNDSKAKRLYEAIDNSQLYFNRIAPKDRSCMNVPFLLKDESLNDAFLEGAKKRGLIQLKGHRISGGMRASIYNAMTQEGVNALIDYMQVFEAAHR